MRRGDLPRQQGSDSVRCMLCRWLLPTGSSGTYTVRGGELLRHDGQFRASELPGMSCRLVLRFRLHIPHGMRRRHRVRVWLSRIVHTLHRGRVSIEPRQHGVHGVHSWWLLHHRCGSADSLRGWQLLRSHGKHGPDGLPTVPNWLFLRSWSDPATGVRGWLVLRCTRSGRVLTMCRWQLPRQQTGDCL